MESIWKAIDLHSKPSLLVSIHVTQYFINYSFKIVNARIDHSNADNNQVCVKMNKMLINVM